MKVRILAFALTLVPPLAEAHNFTVAASGVKRPVSEVIIIASGQRSGSTELSMGLAAHPCVADFNEYFHNGIKGRYQSGRASEYLGDAKWRARGRPGHVASSLSVVRSKAQIEIDKQLAERGEPLCGPTGVAIVFKLFPEHDVSREQVRKLLQSENITVVVLERPAEDRKCSRDFAVETGNWITHPGENHHVNHTACKLLVRTSKAKAAELQAYTKTHDKWFDFVRGASKSAHAALRLEVPFGVWTDPRRSRNVLHSIWAAAGLELVDDPTLNLYLRRPT